MGTILRIFVNDVVSIGRRFFALAIIVAISILPALYAWVNIYANGNPYTNTGNIRIAVASEDPGVTLDDGTHVNMADDVCEELKTSDKIGWQFPGSVEEAVEGVRSGEYYAAIVFRKDFTHNMYDFEKGMLSDSPSITYYTNTKKNAVASKITDTAAGNLQDSIKTKYLEAVFEQVMNDTNEAAEHLEEGRALNSVLDQLAELRDTLRDYDSSISTFTSYSSDVKKSLSRADSKLSSAEKSGRSSVSKAKTDLEEAGKTVKSLRRLMKIKSGDLKTELTKLGELIEKVKADPLNVELRKKAHEQAENVLAILEFLRALIPDDGNISGSRSVAVVLDNMIANMKDVIDLMDTDINVASDLLERIREAEEGPLAAGIGVMIDTLDMVIDQLDPLIGSVARMVGDVHPILDSAGDTACELDNSLEVLQKTLRSAADRIDEVIREVNAAADNDKLQILTDFLKGDPELYSKFFSALVDVNVEEIYSVASYGAAMAPFYSVLAIWVGGVILVSILKTHVDRKKFPEATEAQCYFGRFIIFWLIGQIQAAIIIWGDIVLLGCKPVRADAMFLAASVASFVFVLLIYSLTLSFGDIGKAAVVIIMVVQIAGSSGSYPIEILPEIFGKIYKFFPFPYAINAIREGLCGLYKHDLLIYLGELLVFAVIALAIGLLVRKPFIGINEFVAEKIEETEVL